MLLLCSTSDKLELITGQAVTVDVHTSYVDHVSPSTQTPGNKNTAISTATTTDIVSSPAASTYRNIKAIHIRNKHASLSVEITLRHVNGTATVEMEKVILLAGERFAYTEGEGFRLIDANGIIRAPGAAPASVYTKTLAADLANSTTTAAKVTGLDIAMGIGIWAFEYFIWYTTVATATGIKFGCNHTGTVAPFMYFLYGVQTVTTAADGAMDQDHLATTGGIVVGWSARAKTTNAPMITAGVDTNAGDMLILISGMCIVTVAGNLELYSASEVGASSTSVKAGSIVRLTKAG